MNPMQMLKNMIMNKQINNPILKEVITKAQSGDTKGVEELEYVIKNMRLFGIPETNFKVDLTIARGLDYYTGTVYETFLNEYRELRKCLLRW